MYLRLSSDRMARLGGRFADRRKLTATRLTYARLTPKRRATSLSVSLESPNEIAIADQLNWASFPCSIVEFMAFKTPSSDKALPEAVEDIRVRAELMGRLKAGPSPSMAVSGVSHLFERNAGIACGSSCAPSSENYSGTLGALLRDGQRILALSNNHVFAACNHTPVDMPILSPSTADARPGRRAPGELCRYERMIELRSGDPDLVPPARLDAAIASIPNFQSVSSWQGDASEGFDTPAETMAPKAGFKVKKFGRTTGLTRGTIEALVPTPWILPYHSRKFDAVVWFMDTWTVRSNDGDPFALPGDSGSLIVSEDASSAIGLLFAVNNRGEYGIFAQSRTC